MGAFLIKIRNWVCVVNIKGYVFNKNKDLGLGSKDKTAHIKIQETISPDRWTKFIIFFIQLTVFK